MNDPQLLIGIPDANGFISTPRDSDVLCGRGGAALRHPGNQTYRRLVNLNKGLYITCLKTEKLKISRSIVAAIREQNGRFLEKNATDDKWYDIGDKKAIEKTSQALREGQPKLRQKIVELGTNVGAGGGVAGSTNSTNSASGNHHHLHHNNGGAQYGENNEILIHGLDHHNSSQSHHPNHMNHHQMHQQQQQQQQQQFDNATNAILQQQQKLLQMNSGSNTANSMTASDEIPSSNSMLQLLGNTGNISSLSINNNNNNNIQNNNINTSQNEFNTDYLLHRLSLHDLNQSGNIASLNMNHNHSSSSATGSNINTNTSNNTNNDININTQQQILQQQQQLLQQQQQILYNQQQQQQRTGATNTNVNPMTTRASVARELGISESQLSIMSDFSLYGNNNNNNNNNINNTSNHIMNTSNIGSFMNGLGSGHLTNHLNDSMYSMLLNGSTNMSTGTFNIQNNNNNNNNSHMNQMMSSGGVLSTASNNDLLQQQLMNLDSFRNSSLMGLPISSFHMTQPNGSTTMMDASQSQLPAAATTTTTTTAAAVHLGGTGVGSEGVVGVDPRNLNHGILPSQQQYNNTNNIATNSALIQQQQQQLQLQQQQMQQQQFVQPTPAQPQKRQLPSSSIDTGNTGNPTSIEEKQKFDRRRVFAGMKYTRAPSVQHVSGGETGTSTTNIPTVVAIGGDTTEDPLPLEQQQQHPSSSTNPAISLRSINTLGTMTTSAGNDNNNSTNGTNVDEQLPNFHFVESNLGMETSTMSFFSTLSNTMPSTSNNNTDNVVGTGVTAVSGMQQQPPLPTAGNSTSNNNNNNSSGNGTSATIPSYDQQIYMLQKQQEQLFNASNNLTSSHQNNNNNNISNASRMHPPGAITIDTGYSKVVVESAKVVDKSSGRLNSTSSYNNSNMHHNSANYDAMSIGSRMSMMSGLSRISDGNENDSIFSDLSKKIGNVSTRSMAMSEMSALEIQELNDEDDADDVEDQQQQRLHEQEHHHHDIDVSSSATLTMDDDFP